MSREEALNDRDRLPWLPHLREIGIQKPDEEVRRRKSGTRWRNLVRTPGSERGVIGLASDLFRMDQGRQRDVEGSNGEEAGHFFKAKMLDSQFDILEPPEGEPGVVIVSLDPSTEKQTVITLERLKALGMDESAADSKS